MSISVYCVNEIYVSVDDIFGICFYIKKNYVALIIWENPEWGPFEPDDSYLLLPREKYDTRSGLIWDLPPCHLSQIYIHLSKGKNCSDLPAFATASRYTFDSTLLVQSWSTN